MKLNTYDPILKNTYFKHAKSRAKSILNPLSFM